MASTVSELKLRDSNTAVCIQILFSIEHFAAVTWPAKRTPKPQKPSALRVSVEIGRVNGSLDLVEDAQFVCHVQTLRLR